MILIDKACIWIIQRFPALPPLPWRPDQGTGASVGPIRAACTLLVCGALWGPASNPKPPIVYAPRVEAFLAPPVPAPWPEKHTVPEPSGLLVFLGGVGILVALANRVVRH